ncbi:M48 family metallopeptidase [Candidatus Finniella inopinata]|uniref:M48 family metallopeptidase n=1 Tax=Candidatus Finniella inopinata TaxID=1696036 RepID=UPI001A92E45A|nr:M48 family metallopeptidase [Candidatus Finniella inopinata]
MFTPPPLQEGIILPILGFERQVVFRRDIRRNITITDQQIIVSTPGQDFAKVLEAGLKDHIRQLFQDLCQDLADRLGTHFNKITIRDTRSRWGSCSSKGNLSFSWRLIFAPHAVVKYLAAHEVSHLKHMNHSRVFWKTVASLDPDYQKARQWLRHNGQRLLGVRF